MKTHASQMLSEKHLQISAKSKTKDAPLTLTSMSSSLTKCLNLRGFSAGIQPDQKVSHLSDSHTLLTQHAHSYAIIPHHEVLMSATKTGNGAAATATSIYQSDTMTWTSTRSKNLVYHTVQTAVAESSTQTCKHQKEIP